MTPPISTEARKAAIQTAVTAAKTAVESGQGAAVPIGFKGGELVLPVASVDVDLVLLSPYSHRIKAQLQSLSQAEQDTVASDPYGAQAQEIIARLLRETPGYERIKSALSNDGQQDPGVLTTGGVLVNANTRVVALRELREKYVKAVVLPEDAGPKEITELELRLQMEQEIKQPYSFTSQLLFVEDLITTGNYTAVEVGQAQRSDYTDSRADRKKATDLVEAQLRALMLIREVLAASGGALNYLYFDDKQVAIQEIDAAYQKLKTTKPDEALRIRDAQLAGMITDIGYRELRHVDATLLDNYVAPALQEDTILAPHLDVLLSSTALEEGDAPEGLDLLDDDDDSAAAAGTSLTGLYTLLARTKSDEDITLPAASGAPVALPRAAVVAGLRGALTTAIENKRRDTRQLDNLTAPMIHLKEAARALDRARSAYDDVHQRTGFSRRDFLFAVQEFQRATTEFATATGTLGTRTGPAAPEDASA